MKSKLLLTAFVPFGGESLNPAQEAVKRVRAEAHKLYLPVEYENAAKITFENAYYRTDIGARALKAGRK